VTALQQAAIASEQISTAVEQMNRSSIDSATVKVAQLNRGRVSYPAQGASSGSQHGGSGRSSCSARDLGLQKAPVIIRTRE